MEHSNEIKTLLQSALIVICKSKRFEEDMMLKAQRLGLQGEKRRLRYESTKNHNFINYLKCDFFDTYGMSLFVELPTATPLNAVNSMQEFFQLYLQKMEEQYDALHSVANQLVIANGQHYACHFYEKCRCIVEDIKYYRRTMLEGAAVSWSPEFILLRQTTDCNIHDEYEGKEAEVGYKF